MRFFTRSISRLKKENSISKLLEFLKSRNVTLRYRAFVALSERTDLSKEDVDMLRSMVFDPDPWVKTIALLKFASIGDKSVSAILLEIMEDGTVEDKIDLLSIVSSLGRTDDDKILQLIMLGLIDKKEKVRHKATSAAGLSKSRHLVPYIGDMLNAEHHQERLLAAKALADIGGDESIDYLISLLADDHPDVNAAARIYLADVQSDYVKMALNKSSFLQLIKNMNGSETLREKTSHEIGKDLLREGLPLLHRACKDKYKGVRIEALKSISNFKNQHSVDIVVKLLSDKFHDVRIEAVNTLEKIGGKRAMNAIETAFADTNVEVHKRVEQALGKKHYL